MYRIFFTAWDNNNPNLKGSPDAMCSGFVDVCVPQSQGQNTDKDWFSGYRWNNATCVRDFKTANPPATYSMSNAMDTNWWNSSSIDHCNEPKPGTTKGRHLMAPSEVAEKAAKLSFKDRMRSKLLKRS